MVNRIRSSGDRTSGEFASRWTKTVDLLFAVLLGGVGVVSSRFAAGRPWAVALAVAAWATSAFVFFGLRLWASAVALAGSITILGLAVGWQVVLSYVAAGSIAIVLIATIVVGLEARRTATRTLHLRRMAAVMRSVVASCEEQVVSIGRFIGRHRPTRAQVMGGVLLVLALLVQLGGGVQRDTAAFVVGLAAARLLGVRWQSVMSVAVGTLILVAALVALDPVFHVRRSADALALLDYLALVFACCLAFFEEGVRRFQRSVEGQNETSDPIS